MPTLIRLTLAVAVTAVSASAARAAALSPTDSARIARVFPFEVGQQYQFKAGGDFERPHDEVLPAGQVAEITITDTLIDGKIWLRIPYWSPFGRELYALDDSGRVLQYASWTYVFIDPRPDTATYGGVPGDWPMYVDTDLCAGLDRKYCEPAFYWRWTHVVADSGALVLVTSGPRAAFAYHGGLGPGSSLHGQVVSMNDGFISERMDWGLFRPKSSDPWPEFEKPVRIVGEPEGESAARPEPERLRLQAAPNPFNASTTIRYDVGQPGLVKISVFDVAGRHVRTLVSRRHLSAGTHSVTWDGTDDAGGAAASGVYIVRLVTGASVVHARATLVR